MFYFCFRIVPDELIRERLELEPASALDIGIIITELDLHDLIFSVNNGAGIIRVSDGDRILATFTGKQVYVNSLRYIADEISQ